MAPQVLLQSPLPTGSIAIGQLITDPLRDNMESFTPSMPTTTFSFLRTDTSAQTFLLNSTLQNRTLYFVTGVQSKQNASTTITSAPDQLSRPTTHVRRMDSAVDLDTKEEESIVALTLHRVRCRVGYASEPHSVDDVEYSWSYHALNEEGLQLSIGLGKAVEAEEFKKTEKEEREEDGSDMSWSYGSDEDDEGLGGF